MSGTYEPAEVYVGLRTQALAVTRELLDPETASEGQMLAMLLETGYPEAVATLVGLADGTTSMYFSNGGGMIGAGQHEDVAAATRRSSWARSRSTGCRRPRRRCSSPTRGSPSSWR